MVVEVCAEMVIDAAVCVVDVVVVVVVVIVEA